MASNGPGGRSMDEAQRAMRRHTADYIETMSAELIGLSRTARLDFLTYLLEMVMIEASAAREGNVSTGPGEGVEPAPSPRLSAEQLAARYLAGEIDPPH